MPTTPIYALPYPAASEPADVPLDMQELAERIEAIHAPLAYAELTTGVTIASTTEATPTDILSSGVVTYQAVSIVIEFYSPRIDSPTVAGATIRLNLWDGTTNLGFLATIATPAAAATAMPVYVARRLTPTAASHEYRIRSHASSLTGPPTVQAGSGGAGGHSPCFIRVRRA